jgi:hypothetical protein
MEERDQCGGRIDELNVKNVVAANAVDKLHALRLTGMAEAIKSNSKSPKLAA